MPYGDMYEDELKKRRPAGQVAGATINPKHFSYGAINRDIDSLRNLDMAAPDVNYNYNQGIHQNYGLEDMRDTINRLNTPQQMQYQSPEQMQQMMDTWLGAMQPYLDSQQQVAQSQYNQQVQALQNEWARRGLLGTTAAGMAEMDKAREFGLQSQNMQNAAMMDALAKSFDFANLGLAERDLGLRQDQAGMDAWMNALGMQEQMNQNIRDVNRAMAQDEFNNWADAMGLTLEQKQAVINSMLAGADLESTNQQRSFDNRMGNAMLGLQEQQSYLDNLYRGMGLREDQRQFNFQNALGWSQLFGEYVDPVMTGQGLRPQLQGKQTLGGIQQQADLTGMYQGQMTPYYEQIRAGLTGVDPVTGQPTWDAQQFAQEMEFRQQQLAQQMAIAQMQAAAARQSGGLTPWQEFQMQQYMNDPGVKYGEGYTSFLGSLYQSPPSNKEEYERYQKQLETLVSGGMITKEGASAARSALNIYKPEPSKPSAFTQTLDRWKAQLPALNTPRVGTGGGMLPFLAPGPGKVLTDMLKRNKK